MALEGVFNVPDFQYVPRVEKQGKQQGEKKKHDQHKKKKDDGSGALFDNLAHSLGQYSDEPFQFNG